jgi:hypothetical protein
MANSKNSTGSHEYATVDTAPAQGSGGYYTNAIAPRNTKLGRFYFSIRDTTDDSSPSVVTVKLQFKCSGDSGWTDKLNGTAAWAIGDRAIISDNAAGVQWRAGVVDNSDYTSGSVTFGFDW